jgi:hypothetical protein
MRIGSCLLLVSALVSGCAASRTPLAASLAPSPPGWFAFCAEHGGTAADCDPVPAPVAMLDGPAAMTPPAWRAFCHRHPLEAQCAR